MRITTRKALATLATSVAIAGTAPAVASAAFVPDVITYFRAQQNTTNGGFGAAAGTFEEWAPSALTPLGVDSRTLDNGGGTLQDYLNGKWTGSTWRTAPTGLVATEFERAILNAYAAGIDPARMADRATGGSPQNMIAQLASTYSWTGTRNGRYGNGALNTNVFGLLALAGTPAPGSSASRVPRALLDETADQLVADQHLDGGWDWVAGNPRARSDTDMTGAALAALCEVGYTTDDPVVSNALTFLTTQLSSPTGGFTAGFGVNTDSTGWAVSGLRACGVNPTSATWQVGGIDPLEFIESQQYLVAGTDFGGVKYMPANPLPNFYATIDAARAYAGGAFTSTPATWQTTPSIVSQSAPFALAIVDPSANTRFCRVAVTLDANGRTTLGALLTAAYAGGAGTGSLPNGCVSSYTTSGTTITDVNGRSSWNVRIDGGTAATATTTTALSFGDTVTLEL